jgi:hypothetical protein
VTIGYHPTATTAPSSRWRSSPGRWCTGGRGVLPAGVLTCAGEGGGGGGALLAAAAGARVSCEASRRTRRAGAPVTGRAGRTDVPRAPAPAVAVMNAKACQSGARPASLLRGGYMAGWWPTALTAPCVGARPRCYLRHPRPATASCVERHRDGFMQ